jgi:uncharacterized protein YbjT (DUF2867 family)
MSADLILVTGATGNTGSAVLQQLLEHRARVRAMVRAPSDTTRLSNPSVETVVADFDNAESIDRALQGVACAYLVTPSGPNAEVQQIRFAERAAAAGVQHIVKLSQFAADEASPVRFLRYHAAVERRIRELGLSFTFLRPNLYLKGLLAFQGMIAHEGRFIAPIGEARVSAIDVRDIAAVGALALTQRGHEGRTYTLTGPQAVTHSEMATAIGAAIGRSVTFVDVPPTVFSSALLSAGLTAWQVDGLIEDYAHYARGEATVVSSAVREVTARDPRDVNAFARDFASAFVSSSTST